MTKQWEQYEATIRALYADHTLATVRQIMIERHGFNASVRAYRGRLDRWNVRKYNRRNRSGSVGSESGSADDASGTPAPSRDGNETGSALVHDVIQGGWGRINTASTHHHQYPASISTTAAVNQPPPYSPSQYAQRRHSQKYSEDKVQPSSSLPSSLLPAGYPNSYYFANAQDAPQSSSSYSYGNFAPVTQSMSPWTSSSSVFAPGHLETDGSYGFNQHHDQRIGSTGHVEIPFHADSHNPSISSSGAQDGRYHGAGGEARGYDMTPQDSPGRGGSH